MSVVQYTDERNQDPLSRLSYLWIESGDSSTFWGYIIQDVVTARITIDSLNKNGVMLTRIGIDRPESREIMWVIIKDNTIKNYTRIESSNPKTTIVNGFGITFAKAVEEEATVECRMSTTKRETPCSLPENDKMNEETGTDKSHTNVSRNHIVRKDESSKHLTRVKKNTTRNPWD